MCCHFNFATLLPNNQMTFWPTRCANFFGQHVSAYQNHEPPLTDKPRDDFTATHAMPVIQQDPTGPSRVRPDKNNTHGLIAKQTVWCKINQEFGH